MAAIEKYDITDVIKQLTQSNEDWRDVSEMRATLIVNYCNPNRPHRHVADKNEKTRVIMFKVLEWYEQQMKG